MLTPVLAWAAALLQALVVESAVAAAHWKLPWAVALLQAALVESAAGPLWLAVLTPLVAWSVAQVLQAAVVEPVLAVLAPVVAWAAQVLQAVVESAGAAG